MIEINLLPGEMKPAEGTPAPRLFTVLGGVVIGCALGFFLYKTYIIDIPYVKQEIQILDTSIANLKKKKEEVEKVIKDIETLKQKVATLDGLILGRVRFARVLDYLATATPDLVWYKNFSVQPAAAGGGAVAMGAMGGTAGKRYQINLQGYTMGASEQERKNRLTDLLNRLEEQYRKINVDEKTGMHNFLGAKFDRPQLVSYVEVNSLPEPQHPDPKVSKNLKSFATKQALEFSMTLRFELPAPKTGPAPVDPKAKGKAPVPVKK